MTSSLRLTLEVRDPTVITRGSGRRNSTATFDYLPGSTLRGALATMYTASFGVDADFEMLFERGIRFGNGRPAPDPDHPALLPRPRSTMRCKADPSHFEWDPVLSTALADPAAYRERRQLPPAQCDECGGRLSYQPGWWHPRDRSYQVPVGDSTRTAMADGTAVAGALYSQRDIPTSTRFVADLVGETQWLTMLTQRLTLEATPRLRLGRSKSTNGTVVIVDCQHGDAPSSRVEYTLFDAPLMGARGLALILASPAILLDPFMRPTVNLGIVLPGYELVDTLLDTEQVLGWNSGQGLPKVPDLAVSAGSVFLYANREVAEEPSAAVLKALRALVDRGVGLRRQEGFGDVHLLLPLMAEVAGGSNA